MTAGCQALRARVGARPLGESRAKRDLRQGRSDSWQGNHAALVALYASLVAEDVLCQPPA
jgi:hypothetical protein